jgi:hypothetical protein
MTSRYKSFVSVASVRNVGGVDGSESESSESENPDGSRGGVGSRMMGSGSGGKAWISWSRSCPFRYEFSVRR